jgi:hypothetical protein
MPERTWEAIERPTMIPSLRGKLVNLCERLTQISMNTNVTSTVEDFEIIKFIEDNAPFTMLLGKSWIDKDQVRKKEEKEVLEQKRQELKDFMTRRIVQLIEEQVNKSKIPDTRSPYFKAARMLEDSQKIEVYVSDTKRLFPLSPRK